MTEYCPASIDRGQGIGVAVGAPAATWAYTLEAYGPRSVSGTILAQTDAGWFSFAFDGATLVEQSVEYEGNYATFVRQEYESAPLYMRFPKAVTILRWWVDYVTASGDAQFGWDQKGQVHCLPQAGLGVATGVHAFQVVRRLSPDSNLTVPPPPEVPISFATSVPEPAGMTACAAPFTNARALTRAPISVASAYAGSDVERDIDVLVSIAASGHLDDAWVYFPSGVKALDEAALNAVRGSTFVGGTALCQPAPGQFLYGFTIPAN